ncbi:hypothetical protein [Nocardia grenadensis]|uniref:hypothetical protein n=1 Tax=Nocardia grenadensis TaxID=931537 RepID=UPI003D8A339A
MSERPVEDEIMDEARKFGHSMAQLMRMHAQANGWLEKRKVRRQISLEMRKQRREEQTERAHHLSWTSQMIHRYQIAEQSRRDRITDPRTSPEDRYRAEDSGARHIEELRERIVGNTRLTQVERGVALDCLDSARMWPYEQAKTPEMLVRASKLRGVDALRYRARLARETEWLRERRYEREAARLAREAEWIEQRRGERGPVRQEFVASALQQPSVREQAAPARPTGELTSAQADAIQKIRHEKLIYNEASRGADYFQNARLVGRLEEVSRAAAQTGLTEQRIDWELRTAEQNSRYTSQIQSLDSTGAIGATWTAYHPNEAEASKWVARDVSQANWKSGVQLKAAIHERGNETPARVASGRVEHVAARTAEWARPESQREQAPTTEEMASLKQRHHLSIEHNADLADQNATLTRQLTTLRSERAQLIAERDRYKTERDESVQKLAKLTPAADRLGSPERQAAEHRSAASTAAAEQHTATNGSAFAGLSTNAFAATTNRKGMSR